MLTAQLLLWAVSWISLAESLPTVGELESRTEKYPSKPWRIDVTPAIRAQFDFKPYVLRDVCLDCTRANTTALFQCDVKFEWFDPNSVKENNVTSCSCSYSWEWDGVTTAPGRNNTFDPLALLPCYHKDQHAPFEMRVNNFESPNNLTLWISHLYKDSSLWGPPFVYAQTYAQPRLSLNEVTRKEHSMTYFEAGPILANITGLNA